MATSGVTTWTANRDQVINGALRKLGALPSGGSGSTNQISDANFALNALVKAFHADGMPVWAIKDTNFLTTANVNSYTVGIGQTVNIPQPLKIVQAEYQVQNGVNIPMNIYNRYDFNKLPNNATGTPVNLYYQPLENTGMVYLWPTPIDSTTTIYMDYQRPFEDMVSSTDNFDFPPYWIQALIYALAWTMSPEYGTPLMERNTLAQEAKYWKDEALSYGSEEGSMYFQPTTKLG